MSTPIDAHLRTCMTAVAQGITGDVITLPPNLPSFLEDQVEMLADLAMANAPVDKQVGVSEGVWF